MLLTIHNNSSVTKRIVEIGERNASIALPSHLYTFLVGRVVQYLNSFALPEITFLNDFQKSLEKTGVEKLNALKRLGDDNLILAGLFPIWESGLKLDSEHFREMGKCAYLALVVELGSIGNVEKRRFYQSVAQKFELLEQVLRSSRGIESEEQRDFRILYTKLIDKSDQGRNNPSRPKRSRE